jgi:hypothetical protein
MDSRPVKIYSPENVPRLRYIAGIIIGDILGLSWEVITDKRKLGKHPVINYSTENITGSFKISPDSLLFEKGITGREIDIYEWKGLPVFFRTSTDSDLPFDFFAASFFLISRYEEYPEFQSDEFSRFPASLSLAFKNGFLGIPIIDLWSKEMSRVFLKKFQNLAFKRNEYKSLITIDAEQPFANVGMSLFRSISVLFHDIRSSAENPAARNKKESKVDKDPFDVFDYITEKIEVNNSDVRFFFPVGDHSKFDKNPSWKDHDYRTLIHSIADKFKTGLHPSFYAAGNFLLLNTEAARLKTILGNRTSLSCFHYIRLLMPQSYRDIDKAGITEDYSMGYPEEPGFRAGIARPFYFYDVAEDIQTDLKIIPYQFMDETFFKYKNLDAAVSQDVILKLICETRKAGGLFVSIWHNTSLIDNPERKDFRDLFEYTLKNQTS